jgi:hypothetical protein
LIAERPRDRLKFLFGHEASLAEGLWSSIRNSDGCGAVEEVGRCGMMAFVVLNGSTRCIPTGERVVVLVAEVLDD